MADKNVTVHLNFVVDSSGVSSAAKGIDKASESAARASKNTQSFGASLKNIAGPLLTIAAAKKAFDAVTDSLKKSEEGKKALEEISKASTSVMLGLTAGLMPAVQAFAKMLTNMAPFIAFVAELVGKVLGGAFSIIQTVTMAAYSAILAFWQGMAEGLATLASWIPGLGKVSAGLQKFADEVGKASQAAADSSVAGFIAVKDTVTKGAQDLTAVVTDEEKKRVEEQKRLQKELGDFMVKLSRDRVDSQLAVMGEGVDSELKIEGERYRRQLEDIKASDTYQKLSVAEKAEAIESVEAIHANKVKKIRSDAASESAKIAAKFAEEQAAAVIEAVRKENEAIRGLQDQRMSDTAAFNDMVLATYDEIGARQIARIQDETAQKIAEENLYYEEKRAALEAMDAEDLARQEEKNQLLRDLEADHQEQLSAIREEAEIKKQEKDAEAAETNRAGWTKTQQEALDTALYVGQQVVAIASGVQQLISNITALEIQDIDKATAAQKARAKDSIKDQAALQKEYDRIDKEAEKKKKEAREKEKNAAIIMAIINGAVAIVKGYSDYGPIVGSVMAVITAAVTATQIALIASQSFAKGGIVQGDSTTGDRTLVRANAGEVILNRSQQANLASQLSSGNTVSVSDTIIINGNADSSTVESIRNTRTEQLDKMREMLLDLQYRGQMV